jgi:2-polyprenyl-3-methyl-5-hydroxy-6-metoxy-1,4-benzoquinol methylase
VTNYHCRGCKSAVVVNLGRLPEINMFAGKPTGQALPLSSLFRCSNCNLVARYPILSPQEYNRLYAQAESDLWSNPHNSLRPDQMFVSQRILNQNKPLACVLDIGCYTGDLLKSLPNSMTKYGVEMSAKAAQIAKNANIKIIASDLYDLHTDQRFDFIIAIDVIEHTQNPAEFLMMLLSLLSEDGEVIISTGNADNWLWKILKSQFWYSSFPEHISFIGVAWLNDFCQRHKVSIAQIGVFNYRQMSTSLVIKNKLKTILALAKIQPIRFSNTSSDHFYFSLKKDSGA